MKKYKRGTIILLAGLAALAVMVAYNFYEIKKFDVSPRGVIEEKNNSNQSSNFAKENNREDLGNRENDSMAEENKEKEEAIIPSEYYLAVPFTSQAPYADWSEPWQNACEEAAILMVHNYYQGGGEIAPERAVNELGSMVDWQINNWGGHFDLNAEEIAKLARDYYGYKDVEVIYSPTLEDIRRLLASGVPLVAPAAGRELHNPQYTPPGPYYHNLLVKGYNQYQIITNDMGTAWGNDYSYNNDVFMAALHDFDEHDILGMPEAVVAIHKQ